MVVLLKAFGILLLADFVTGVVHWLEDSFWSPETPILGKWIVVPNLDHHKNGQAFLNKSWMKSSWDLLLAGILLIGISYIFYGFNWEILLFALLIINANQIHKWAHITRYENKPKIIGLLQKTYLLQRTDHHGQHHRKPNNSHYCVITNVLNPILDNLKFWRAIEYLVGKKSFSAQQNHDIHLPNDLQTFSVAIPQSADEYEYSNLQSTSNKNENCTYASFGPAAFDGTISLKGRRYFI